MSKKKKPDDKRDVDGQITQQSLMLSVPLIEHTIEGGHIHQRPKDGYVNATEMCKAAGKRWPNYRQNATTQAFLDELSSVAGIPTTEIVQTIQGGNPQYQGTWVHPDVAVHLGQWLSPKFAVWVAKWVREWVRGNVSGFMPPHVRRYMMNKAKIPPTHFSMLNEIYLEVLASLDDAQVRIPSSMMPDISTGKMFSNFLRDMGIDVDTFQTYDHEFPDGRIVHARLYPVEYLGSFRKFLYETWIPERAVAYFEKRLPAALPHIKHLLTAGPLEIEGTGKMLPPPTTQRKNR